MVGSVGARDTADGTGRETYVTSPRSSLQSLGTRLIRRAAAQGIRYWISITPPPYCMPYFRFPSSME
jgi:hypothetical protein